MAKKKAVVLIGNREKRVVSLSHSTNGETMILRFDMLDRDGLFAFDLDRRDFQHREVFEKLIQYSNMTWNQITSQTHDQKGKHHMLNANGLSGEARERVRAKHYEEYSDSIFSLALQNRLRVIGIRIGREFHVVWYDPNHEFYPVSR